MQDKGGSLPISALLSQTLVAFIIEFDNEFEHRVPHRTSLLGATEPGAPWLLSRVMWSRFLRFVPEEGIGAAEWARQAGLGKAHAKRIVIRMVRWWGYLWVDKRLVIRWTDRGSKAREVWASLTGEIEQRWNERFGKKRVQELRKALTDVANGLDGGLPDSLPILGYGLYSKGAPSPKSEKNLDFPGLLSKVLLAFAIEFENESEVSLAIGADVLRVTSDEGIAVRDLPRLAGVSKEAIATAASYLTKQGYAKVEGEPGVRGSKKLVLTQKGGAARTEYDKLIGAIEKRWQARFGDALRKARGVLEQMNARLFEGLMLPPDCWRSHVPEPVTLPHFPMVLHRGGYPDGS